MPNFTLGIEEEFQIVDPETRDLRSHVSEILADGIRMLGDKVKPELHQCMIEVGTGVCANIQEAREDLFNLRRNISQLAQKRGVKIAAASTHPFAHWAGQKITEHDRYMKIVEDHQVLSRSLLIFGLHVHVGMEDRETAIHIMNAARYLLPHLLALSTSSPFWMGVETGLKS